MYSSTCSYTCFSSRIPLLTVPQRICVLQRARCGMFNSAILFCSVSFADPAISLGVLKDPTKFLTILVPSSPQTTTKTKSLLMYRLNKRISMLYTRQSCKYWETRLRKRCGWLTMIRNKRIIIKTLGRM